MVASGPAACLLWSGGEVRGRPGGPRGTGRGCPGHTRGAAPVGVTLCPRSSHTFRPHCFLAGLCISVSLSIGESKLRSEISPRKCPPRGPTHPALHSSSGWDGRRVGAP